MTSSLKKTNKQTRKTLQLSLSPGSGAPQLRSGRGRGRGRGGGRGQDCRVAGEGRSLLPSPGGLSAQGFIIIFYVFLLIYCMGFLTDFLTRKQVF